MTGWVLLTSIAISSTFGGLDGPFKYPETQRVDQVDTYHGIQVADPYRWLEEDVRESKEVANWVTAQNKVTNAYLKKLPGRKAIEERLHTLWDFEKYGAPFKAGGRYYYLKNDGLQNQYVLYVMESLDAEPRVLIDPNTWSEDGTIALESLSFSDDGVYMAYGVAEAGSDWRTWRVMEIETGKILEDTIEWVKFSGATWSRDSKGFFYGRFPAPEEGAAFQALNLNQELYYHRIGTPQDADILVHATPEHPEWMFGADATEDGRYLVITTVQGTDERYRIAYKDLAESYGMVTDLITNFDHEYTFLGNDGPVFYFKTDFEAPKRRIISIDIRTPEPEHWREIVAESEDVLEGAGITGNLFILSYLRDARTHVAIHHIDGSHLRDVELPGIGTASGFGGRRTHTETFYSFSSFATPPSIYRYDLITGESTLMRRAEVDCDPEDYEVKQVFYSSKDGTKVPMFIVYKKGIQFDGTNPTLLYGYGGFNVSLTPGFSISRLAWVQMGGIFAMANLRGGGEYGKDWHKAGTKLHKQNVFDDFIAAAEYLIAKDYTSPKHLAIQGGSNGGLLVGAVMCQRPELFGACLPAVGVMDMLRFHLFSAGRYWVDDYGSADDPEEFKALLAYSPYHNLEEGTSYPPTLITTADTDDRVVPGHSFKFAATLQHAQAGNAPVMIRIETRAGHGSGKPTEKVIEEYADMWAFIAYNLGLEI